MFVQIGRDRGGRDRRSSRYDDDRGRDRDRDRRDSRRDRSRDRDRGRDDDRNGGGAERQTSEERRAMIASWNAEPKEDAVCEPC